MSATTVVRMIDAPIEQVFEAVSDIRNFSRAVPHITSVEFLTEQKVGVGTRFRETRVMKGREATTELEVTEYVENDRVRMVSDTNGTIWDTVFSVRAQGDATELSLVMDARAHSLLSKVVNPLIKGMIAKAIGEDMDSIKRHCEQAETA